MPEIDGYETFKLLKENKETSTLRVVFLSNLGQTDEINEGKKMGADDYLIKSGLTPTMLVEKVKKIIGNPN
jgi:DNA-binding response OmpR family regulator